MPAASSCGTPRRSSRGSRRPEADVAAIVDGGAGRGFGSAPSRALAPASCRPCSSASARRGRVSRFSSRESASDPVLLERRRARRPRPHLRDAAAARGAVRDGGADARPMGPARPARFAARGAGMIRPRCVKSPGLPLICAAAVREPRADSRPLPRARARAELVYHLDENNIVHGMVAAGAGVALVPELAVDPNDDRVAVGPSRPEGAAPRDRAGLAPRPLSTARGRGVRRTGARAVHRAGAERGACRGRRLSARATSASPLYTFPRRGVSSAGRAPALQAGGHRFDPGTLHSKKARGCTGLFASDPQHRHQWSAVWSAFAFGRKSLDLARLPLRESSGEPWRAATCSPRWPRRGTSTAEPRRLA